MITYLKQKETEISKKEFFVEMTLKKMKNNIKKIIELL